MDTKQNKTKQNSKILLLLFSVALFLCGIANTATAQTTRVTGTVIDGEGLPLPGVSVTVKGNTTKGAATDDKGKYSLSGLNKSDILVFNFIGMQAQEIAIGERSIIDVTMTETTMKVDEVVVTALGLKKQARSVGYATTKVETDELQRVNVINPVSALQGKVAGLNINTGGASGVTSSSSITIRGASSIDKNNSPIWVVDGIIIQEPITGALSGTDWGSQLKNLNPADYESVTVLKGAAATALYGSRGANGAIVIVSKGGRYGKRGLGVEVSQTVEVTDIYKSPIELQNVYGAGSPSNGFEGGFLADGSLQQTSNSWGPKMDGSLIDQYFLGGEKTPFVSHPDNWKKLYKTGVNSNTSVAINGGGEDSSFRLSYSFTDNNGVFKRNEFKRHSISFKGLTNLNKVFSVEVGVQYAFSDIMNGANQGGWNWGGNLVMISTYYTPRNLDYGAYENVYRDPVTHAVETDSPYGTLRGYLHNRDMNVNKRYENSMLANLKLTAHIIPKLDASIQGNYNYYGISTMSKGYGTGEYYGPRGSGSYARGGSNSGSYNFLAMLASRGHEIKIGSETITLDAILAAELYGNTEAHSWSKSTKGGLSEPGVFSFSNSMETITPSYNFTPRNNQTFGVSAIVNLGWRDQLYLEITARNDWLSSLTYPKYMVTGKNNYSVFYPSFNLSWIFTETFRDQMPEWFSMGKLRASWARVGMGTSAYATTNGFGVYGQSSQYAYDRNSVLIANPNLGTAWTNDLKSEIQNSIEIGTDLRFFKERLNVDFAWYKKNTYNQIMTVASVSESGASQQLINAGNIQNSGIELQIDGTPIRTKDFRWTIGGTLTLNRGKIKKLHKDTKEWQLMGQYDGGPEIWAYEGGEFGVITTSYANTYGAAIYRFNNENDANDMRNGKPVISYWGRAATTVPVYGYVTNPEKGLNDRVKLGKVEPNYMFSFNTSFSYKQFDFYAQIDGRVGGNYFSNAYKYASATGSLKSSLNGRDQAHGGIARIDYNGNTAYNGIMLDAVFDDGSVVPSKDNPTQSVDVSGMLYKDAVEQGLINPMLSSAFYTYNYGWGMPGELGMQKNTWVSLREITLGYRVPEKWIKKIGLNYCRVGLTARNICYLVNKLTDGMNPESISSNNPLTPIDIGGVPFYRTYALSLTLRF